MGFGFNGRCVLGKSDVTFAIGHVLDLDRFPKQTPETTISEWVSRRIAMTRADTPR